MKIYLLYHNVDLGYNVLFATMDRLKADRMKITHNEKYDSQSITWKRAYSSMAPCPWLDKDFGARFGSLDAYNRDYAEYILGRIDGIEEVEVV